MKLLREADFNDIELLTEGEGHNKTYRVKGPFVVADIKNKNGRVYPKTILEREIKQYNESKILTKRSVGELDHAQGPSINLDRISHLVESIEWRDNVGFGCAKLLDTPMGRIAKALVDGSVQLGISSRGLGTVVNNTVDESYKFICLDLVHEPSGPGCVLDAVLESKEYVINGSDVVEVAVSNLKKKLDRKGSRELSKYLKEFINDIGKNQ